MRSVTGTKHPPVLAHPESWCLTVAGLLSREGGRGTVAVTLYR